MEHSPSWEANRFSASQKILRILWSPKVHYRIHNSVPPVSILSAFRLGTCRLLLFNTPTWMQGNRRHFFQWLLQTNLQMLPIPIAARSKAWVCGRSLTGIAGSNPTGGMESVSRESCVLSGRVLCEGPITRPEDSYRLCCVLVCDLESSWMRRRSSPGELWRHTIKETHTGAIHNKFCILIGLRCWVTFQSTANDKFKIMNTLIGQLIT